MKITFCDICNRQILYNERVELFGAISVLAKSDVVYPDCHKAIKSISWGDVIRNQVLTKKNS